MIPRLTELEPVTTATQAYLDALRAGGFTGDISSDAGSRLVTATDNSVYQLLPQAVLFPRSTADVSVALQAATRFPGLTVTPRGGGTGTNGQSLTAGVVLDLSRHLSKILEVNLDGGWVRVQPGVVLDQLNQHLRPHGVFFAPNLSPSNRATLGGMINTDACGEGSRVHGRTSEHVLELEAVLADGTVFRAAPTDEAGLKALCDRQDAVGALHRAVDRVVTTHEHTIRAVFPRLRRYMTGYNLALVRGSRPRQAPEHTFDLTYLLCGSEGTLAVVTEARLRLTPLAKARRLVVLEFESFESALASAEAVAAASPSAIESIDEKVLGLARADVVWHEVGHIFDRAERQSGPRTRAINLVQFEGADEAAVTERAQALVQNPTGAIGVYVVPNPTEAAALWNLRKKGVGLLGNAPGRRKPIPFVEDTVVPPEALSAYVKEFRALLDAAGLEYGMFGHVDVGCLHVRPALDLKDPEDEQLLHRLSEQVVALVRRYGGVIWGEHGKGFRSEYNPLFFGQTLYGALCEIKAAADPEGRLNPGKLAVPAGSGKALARIDTTKRGAYDRQIPEAALDRFSAAVNCNGNGQCFDFDADNVMCPSSKVTRDRIHSPKGRAGLMREWVRQLGNAGVDAGAPRAAPALPRLAASLRGGYDFSHDVYAAMDGCLACKACAKQCPIQVDVPAFRSEFLELYHTRYLRPLRDHLVGRLEAALPWLARFPRISNWLSGNALARAILRRIGLVDTPPLATTRPVLEGVRRLAPGETLTEAETGQTVVLLQDAFTTFYEPHVLTATVELLQALGYEVALLPFVPSGKGWHVKGFLKRFRAEAERWERLLAPLSGATVLGIEPAVVLVYRDEIPKALGRPLPVKVSLLQEWLAAPRMTMPAVAAASKRFRLLGHCTERTAVPTSNTLWRQVFSSFGLSLTPEAVGCCGMCGAFGHETRHAEESKRIFAMSWGPHLEAPADSAEPLATGHSCRSQTERCNGRRLRHPVEALLEALRQAQGLRQHYPPR